MISLWRKDYSELQNRAYGSLNRLVKDLTATQHYSQRLEAILVKHNIPIEEVRKRSSILVGLCSFPFLLTSVEERWL
jgi:hypothetical protein